MRATINIPQLEVLAALQRQLLLGLASSALETQDDLLGSLGLLVEDGLGLTTITTLLAVVTTLTLGVQGGLYITMHQHDLSLRYATGLYSPFQPCTG